MAEGPSGEGLDSDLVGSLVSSLDGNLEDGPGSAKLTIHERVRRDSELACLVPAKSLQEIIHL